MGSVFKSEKRKKRMKQLGKTQFGTKKGQKETFKPGEVGKMRINLLVVTDDGDYAGHLSEYISEHHADMMNVNICSTPECLQELLPVQKFDAALLEPYMIKYVDLHAIHLPLLLWTDEESYAEAPEELKGIRKYQRISSIVASVVEQYAAVSTAGRGVDSEKAHITAVWSPTGGVGKTIVALAYAEKMASAGKQVLYLNLETFSSIPAFFADTGKSISRVFDLLEYKEGNVKMLIRGIQKQDSGAGVMYFCSPDNFDDMNILSSENIALLLDACAGVSEELVIDMSCVCDERAWKIFELTNKVFLVTDATTLAHTKLSQFVSQNNVFERIKEKTVLIANKGESAAKSPVEMVISLPYVHTTDAIEVYKTLADNRFEVHK